MVAQKNETRIDQRSPYSKGFYPFLLLGVVVLIIFGIPKWEEAVRKNDEGVYELQDWREDERITELDRNEQAEQYRLIALTSRYYPCYLCKKKQIWINAGETLKIGITTIGTSRYNQAWLKLLKLDYFIDTIGDLATVRRAEINKIANYPL